MKETLRAFRVGANVLAYCKENKKYGMTCAWAMMIDYSKVALLVGSQSVTGNNLRCGDIVGINSLAMDQHFVSRNFGNSHSDEVDKFVGIDYTEDEGCIFINGAKVQMKCVVESISNIDGDNLIFFKVLDFTDNKEKDFLDGYDPKCYK